MYGTYDLAKRILDERRREAATQRLTHELRHARRRRVTAVTPEHEVPWTLEWTVNGVTGKRVTLANEVTGARPTGRDPADWDRAMGQAVRELDLTA